mmetsp:Transcript_163416/g.519313  ORF Transcript_163416/g.519313 Transcript_163416/m.519313 type:complete len:214 (+) Transcript_163416:623-1264(+)
MHILTPRSCGTASHSIQRRPQATATATATSRAGPLAPRTCRRAPSTTTAARPAPATSPPCTSSRRGTWRAELACRSRRRTPGDDPPRRRPTPGLRWPPSRATLAAASIWPISCSSASAAMRTPPAPRSSTPSCSETGIGPPGSQPSAAWACTSCGPTSCTAKAVGRCTRWRATWRRSALGSAQAFLQVGRLSKPALLRSRRPPRRPYLSWTAS